MRTDLLSQRHTEGLRWSQSWLIGKVIPHLHLFSESTNSLHVHQALNRFSTSQHSTTVNGIVM